MTESKSPIVFYCKDCGKIVDASKFGKRYVYTCKICGTKNVAFGTEKSIKSFFRIPEEKEEIVPVSAPTAVKTVEKSKEPQVQEKK
jgi:ATP sulfurylase